MAFVRRQLAPTVSVQQVVDRGQRHAAAHRCLQLDFDLWHYQDAAVAGTLQKGLQHLVLARHAQVLAPPTAGPLALAVPYRLASQEPVAQPTRPDH